eukprot:TRINITY_DN90604_c0_g1_i1.p1 TRINITY_DN90604_c0_g1~~TRINITY_DN90604_c0_g1_i1.p1  ORF type:complete len:690 (-),score=147.90 TRINITY_DN90604_c0_g1_i1:205-2274(-)
MSEDESVASSGSSFSGGGGRSSGLNRYSLTTESACSDRKTTASSAASSARFDEMMKRAKSCRQTNVGASQMQLQKQAVEEKVKSFGGSGLHTEELQEMSSNSTQRRLQAAKLLDGICYQVGMAIATIVSVGMVVVETDLRATESEPSQGIWLAGLALIFIFCIDLCLRLFVFHLKFFYNFVSCLEFGMLVMDICLEFSPGAPNFISALKVIRFIRLTRILRSLSQLRDLYLMMQGILASVQALMFATVLVFMMLTLFSILAVVFVRPIVHDMHEEGLFSDCERCRNAFDSVMRSNLTLAALVVVGEDWGRMVLPIVERSNTALFIMLSAFVVINLGLLNTIAAVIVDRQVEARREDVDYQAALQSEELLNSLEGLQDMFKSIDTEGNGTTTLDELLNFYNANETFRTILNRMDIHLADVPTLFDILDADETGDVGFEEFVTGLHSLKHENGHTLAVFTKHGVDRIVRKVEDADTTFDFVDRLERRMKEQTAMLHSLFENIQGASPHCQLGQAYGGSGPEGSNKNLPPSALKQARRTGSVDLVVCKALSCGLDADNYGARPPPEEIFDPPQKDRQEPSACGALRPPQRLVSPDETVPDLLRMSEETAYPTWPQPQKAQRGVYFEMDERTSQDSYSTMVSGPDPPSGEERTSQASSEPQQDTHHGREEHRPGCPPLETSVSCSGSEVRPTK